MLYKNTKYLISKPNIVHGNYCKHGKLIHTEKCNFRNICVIQKMVFKNQFCSFSVSSNQGNTIERQATLTNIITVNGSGPWCWRISIFIEIMKNVTSIMKKVENQFCYKCVIVLLLENLNFRKKMHACVLQLNQIILLVSSQSEPSLKLIDFELYKKVHAEKHFLVIIFQINILIN